MLKVEDAIRPVPTGVVSAFRAADAAAVLRASPPSHSPLLLLIVCALQVLLLSYFGGAQNRAVKDTSEDALVAQVIYRLQTTPVFYTQAFK